MRPPLSHWTQEQQHAIAMDLLIGKDTLAGLAHAHHVTAHQLLEWKASLVQNLKHGRRRTAA